MDDRQRRGNLTTTNVWEPTTARGRGKGAWNGRAERRHRTRREERGKYADYEDLKAKAAKYDEAQEAAKTELERANERAAKAEAEAQQLREQKARADLAARVSAATGVPASLIQGATEAEMQASADAIASFAKAAKPNVPSDKGGAANQHTITPEGIEGIKDPVARVRARAQNLSLYE